jgi:pimeloyl-ACP methyl ester carboxylesterase
VVIVQVVFLHGLETGPHGAKWRALSAVLAGVIAPDCEGVMDIEERLSVVERALAGKGDLLLVGSSFGGLAAVLFASRHPDRVRGCVLCAPAVHRTAAAGVEWLPAETVIIHGRDDEVVPLREVEAFARRFPWARLLVVDDGHRLARSHDVLVDEVTRMIRRRERQP